MCWSILYRENKIALNKPASDWSIYRKVNVLDDFDYPFHINQVTIENKLCYDITYGQCACDFFIGKNIKLRETFMDFISKRIEIPCVEPGIFISWMDGAGVEKLPQSNEIEINEYHLPDIFTQEYDEVYYRVQRMKWWMAT